MSAEEYAPDPRAPEALPILPAGLSWRRVALSTSDEGSEGMLVFWADRLIAVLGRVELERRRPSQQWHLEVGFGDCAPPPSGLIFPSLAQALRWLAARSDRSPPPSI
jgi:hypothetical protein